MTALNYSTGTITLTNGSAVVTGTGTAWQTALITGGTIYVQAAGNPLPISTVDSNTQITAAIKWTGASGTYAYVLRIGTEYDEQVAANAAIYARLLAELEAGTIWKYDAAGDTAGRATYDARPKGFSYLDVSGAQPVLWVKASNTEGDWNGPFAYGVGPIGPMGPAGFMNWRGTYAGATAYARNDGVYYNGSAFVALQATNGHAPPTLPTTANAYWSLLAIKGQDGLGTGDVVGPSGSVDNRVAAMSGTTGKLIKDSGVLITSLPRVDAAQSFSQAQKVLMAANIGMGYVQIGERVSFTNSAAVAWTNLSEYSELQLEFSAIGNAACNLGLQVSVDNGANWLSGANDYAYKITFFSGTSVTTGEVATANRFPIIGASLANIMDTSALISRFNKSQTKRVRSDAAYFDSGSAQDSVSINSGYFNAGVANALRLISATGTWTGNATLWGRKG